VSNSTGVPAGLNHAMTAPATCGSSQPEISGQHDNRYSHVGVRSASFNALATTCANHGGAAYREYRPAIGLARVTSDLTRCIHCTGRRRFQSFFSLNRY
jgi:hypothetical protein